MVGIKTATAGVPHSAAMTETHKPAFSGRFGVILSLSLIAASVNPTGAEPIIVNGAMLPELTGAPIGGLRVLSGAGKLLPFQIDEKTPGGEYVCPQGEQPNADSGNGLFDTQDEIVFLWEDIAGDKPGETATARAGGQSIRARCTVRRGADERVVMIADDPRLPLLAGVISYDHETQCVRTPYYFARFGRDRFHFVRAGCIDPRKNVYIDLTNELRVEIVLTMLWGLIPIRYTEESMVCHVKRYKAGPLRLIRRGDFHLNLGMGVRGSRAAVNQLCYPQMVEVPVRITLPLRFNRLFNEAFIEMTPVLRAPAASFRFAAPSLGFTKELSGDAPFDTLIPCVPDKGYVLGNGANGFVWLMRISADAGRLSGSGYVLRRPSKRGALADCGFRLAIRDLPKGSYDIVNRVLFPGDSSLFRLADLSSAPGRSIIITSSGTFENLLGKTNGAISRGNGGLHDDAAKK